MIYMSANTLFNKRHSLAHILLMSVKHHFPRALPTIGPVIDNGFYYDFDFVGGSKITPEDFPKIEKTMREIIATEKNFTVETVTVAQARNIFKENKYKLELISGIEKLGTDITVYHTGNDFSDLCEGPHVANTKEIALESFKLDKLSGAYWRGDEKNAMLTRVYGLAFDTKEELDAYIAQLEEAKKRDHRILGKQLKL